MKAPHIAHHTTDEVNLESATQAAQECGSSLSRLADPVARPSTCAPQSCTTWTTWTPSARASGRQRTPFSAGTIPRWRSMATTWRMRRSPVLNANGVIVSRKFNPELVRALCRVRAFAHSRTWALEMRLARGVGRPRLPMRDGAVTGRARPPSDAPKLVGTPNVLPQEIDELRERISQVEQHLDRFRRHDHLRLVDLQRWLEKGQLGGVSRDGFLARPPRSSGVMPYQLVGEPVTFPRPVSPA